MQEGNSRCRIIVKISGEKIIKKLQVNCQNCSRNEKNQAPRILVKIDQELENFKNICQNYSRINNSRILVKLLKNEIFKNIYQNYSRINN